MFRPRMREKYTDALHGESLERSVLVSNSCEANPNIAVVNVLLGRIILVPIRSPALSERSTVLIHRNVRLIPSRPAVCIIMMLREYTEAAIQWTVSRKHSRVTI
jgi:hypothetical protein